MALADLTALLTVPALVGSVTLVYAVRRGNARGGQQAAIATALLMTPALTLADLSLSWPPIAQVAAPLSLAVCAGAVFTGAERPDRHSDIDWSALERSLVGHGRPDDHTRGPG
jgi:hypothetical protein